MDQIPNSLRRLISMVMRGFYSIEHVLVMDMLIRKPCMKEEDLETLLKFERKHLRAVIAQLKMDKMLKSRLKIETGPDGKTTKQNYYYINYKAFVDVVKYKLDHMRRKIETEERDSTSRASFICTQCKKTYTDLEADQLCDLSTGEFRCSYCGAVVDEDPNVLPKADSRLVLARFNDQIETLYILLKEVEGITLPSDILEPEPSDSSVKSEMIRPGYTIDGHPKWNESKKSSIEYDSAMFSESNLTVKIEPDANESIAASDGSVRVKEEHNQDENGRIKKEQPAWLTSSTVYEESNSSVQISRKSDKESKVSIISSHHHHHPVVDDNSGSAKEILETLLVYEKAHENSSAALSFLNASSAYGMDEANDTFDQSVPDEEMDTDDEEVDDAPMVRVGAQYVRLSEICDEHIEVMSIAEKEEYVKLTQEVYAHMYDI